ncbi:MAG TPA: hypothetical protein VHG35_09295 [Gemmatimonadales bacterium]|nr:hypothetical protein [Gemmatimonadales bacterium]
MQRLRIYPFIALGLLAAAPVAVAQGTGAPISVRLETVGGSGISGTAELRQRDRETEFAITLNSADRARGDDEFDVWLRAGTCTAPGRTVEDIDDVEADGETETEDEDVVLAELLRSPHVLEVRVEDSDDVVACGAIRG